MSDAKQTMISVKKSDGTTVKMSLVDFKKYQTELTQKKTVVSEPANTPSNNLPAKIQNESVATSTPVVKAFVNEAEANVKKNEANHIKSAPATPVTVPPRTPPPTSTPAPRSPVRLPQRPAPEKPKQWSRDDYSSPLSEKSVPVNNSKNDPTPADGVRVDIERIIRESGISVPDGLKLRMTNLISSVVDGVRERSVAIEFATRPIANGGLGLNETQVSVLMQKIDAAIDKKMEKPRQITHVLPENLRPVTASIKPVPATTKTQSHVASQKLDQIVRSDAMNSNSAMSMMRPAPVARNNTEVKTQVADIKIPVRERTLVGPVDEFASMTLNDWRRMAVNTEGSLNLLMNKFDALMRESFTLFLAARDAWRGSEIFRAYIDIIKRSISERRTVEEIIGNTPNMPNMAEFRAIVELNESISN